MNRPGTFFYPPGRSPGIPRPGAVPSGPPGPGGLFSLAWLLVLGLVLPGLFLVSAFFNCPAQARQEYRVLNSGWYPREPFQMEARTGEVAAVTGLDIQVARELFDAAGYSISFSPMAWSAMLEGLRGGTVDFVMGAYYEKHREPYAYYSTPYRTEEKVIYYHANQRELGGIGSLEELMEVLTGNPYRMAYVQGYAYGSEEFEDFLKDPPPALDLVLSSGYDHSLEHILEGRVDLFVSNPITMDRMLAERGYSDRVKKLRLDMGKIPVHIMFSKETISAEQVKEFDLVLGELGESGTIRSLHTHFILPVFLSITKEQPWFGLLNLLGIAAFCTSGVILARKERYNFSGALVLATLPAIGGGVLRDIILGADQVFVLKSPAYLLVAVGVVLVSFIAFKGYDYLYGSSREITRKIDEYAEDKLGRLVDQLFKLFDAWAVASFTIIGVSVAVEMRTSPLWLWGPAVGVLTAAGGVVLRDIVRADFNIEMLKQDSYAELSLLGGILYTAILMHVSQNLDPTLIFYYTLAAIIILFGLRFFILWKEYVNPLQFGSLHTHPDTRLQHFTRQEPRLWQLLTRYFGEDGQGQARPVPLGELEGLHNQFLYRAADLREALDKVAEEPLNNATVRNFFHCNSRLDITTSLEGNLYALLGAAAGLAGEGDPSRQAAELQQRVYESLKTLLETAGEAIETGDPLDFSLLESITSNQQERFNQLRGKYSLQLEQGQDPYLARVLQATHKVERIIYLLSDYVGLRLQRKDSQEGSTSNRKGQQSRLLNT